MERLVLHACCAPCAIYPRECLKDAYELIIYFFNPNIFPTDEYARRKDELARFAEREGCTLVFEASSYDQWRADVAEGYEDAPEGGERCARCYRYRLERAKRYAERVQAKWFASVMSISPHKRSDRINAIGMALSENTRVAYAPSDFKRNDGFKKACALSRLEGFYRQNYCGCEFSRAAREARLKEKASIR